MLMSTGKLRIHGLFKKSGKCARTTKIACRKLRQAMDQATVPAARFKR